MTNDSIIESRKESKFWQGESPLRMFLLIVEVMTTDHVLCPHMFTCEGQKKGERTEKQQTEAC